MYSFAFVSHWKETREVTAYGIIWKSTCCTLGISLWAFSSRISFLAKQLRVNGYLKNFANLSRNKSHTSHLPSTQTWSEPERQRVPSRSLGDNLAMISLPSARQMRAHGLSGSSIASHVYLLPRYSFPLKALHCSFL